MSRTTRTIVTIAAAILTLAVAGCSAQSHDATFAGDTTGILDQDYGPLVLPPDALPGDLDRWAACSLEGQGNARSALRYVAPWASEGRVVYGWTTYVAAQLDGERTECLEALLSLLGSEIVAVEPGWATHLRETRLLGRLVETDQPLGYFVTYTFDPTRGRPTVWGLQAPPPTGTPWYLDGAPAFARIVGADSPD